MMIVGDFDGFGLLTMDGGGQNYTLSLKLYFEHGKKGIKF